MNTNDRHRLPVPAELLAEIGGEVDSFIEKLTPVAVTLSAQDRRTLPKMGEKSTAFVTKGNEIAHTNADLFPSYLNREGYDVDFADAVSIQSVLNRIRRLEQMLDDTALAARSEALQTTLSFYNSLQIASKANLPGAKTLFAELKKRFPNTKRRSTTNNTPTE